MNVSDLLLKKDCKKCDLKSDISVIFFMLFFKTAYLGDHHLKPTQLNNKEMTNYFVCPKKQLQSVQHFDEKSFTCKKKIMKQEKVSRPEGGREKKLGPASSTVEWVEGF